MVAELGTCLQIWNKKKPYIYIFLTEVLYLFLLLQNM